jgi:hypothetical protein
MHWMYGSLAVGITGDVKYRDYPRWVVLMCKGVETKQHIPTSGATFLL